MLGPSPRPERSGVAWAHAPEQPALYQHSMPEAGAPQGGSGSHRVALRVGLVGPSRAGYFRRQGAQKAAKGTIREKPYNLPHHRRAPHQLGRQRATVNSLLLSRGSTCRPDASTLGRPSPAAAYSTRRAPRLFCVATRRSEIIRCVRHASASIVACDTSTSPTRLGQGRAPRHFDVSDTPRPQAWPDACD